MKIKSLKSLMLNNLKNSKSKIEILANNEERGGITTPYTGRGSKSVEGFPKW